MLDFFTSPAWEQFKSGPGIWMVGGVAGLAVMAWLLWLDVRRQREDEDDELGVMATPSQRALDGVDTLAGWPPQVTRLLSIGQRRAHALLRQALPEFEVFAQVPVSRFVRVPTRLSYQEWLRRIGNRCADFLVCDQGGHILMVIEVRTPADLASKATRKRNIRLERLLAAANVPVLVWQDKALPSAAEVRQAVLPHARHAVMPARPSRPPTPAPSAPPLGAHDGDTIPGIEPPSAMWFDDFNATRPADFDAATPPPRTATAAG